MNFTTEQVRELEDKILNFISPIHTKLSMALMGHGGLMEKDLRIMIGRIEKTADYIRSLHKTPILHKNKYKCS